jgi:hypothetical protein
MNIFVIVAGGFALFWLIRSFVVTAQAALQVVDTVASWGGSSSHPRG